ncbi:Mismatch repair protein msh3 [Marasmius crinis-equi]|uniref:MutS protein homolog 3 n=1 Tax=Marasmius crinis-equi TaxID=585013 RepID=A0ABR3FY92_9AGAR
MSPKGGRQAILSSYFSQPPSSPDQQTAKKRRKDIIDLTSSDVESDNVDATPVKRQKTAQHTCTNQSSPSLADQWRYGASSSAGPSTVDASSKQARHEAFKKKLLLENKKAFLFRRPFREDSPEDLPEESETRPTVNFPKFARQGSGRAAKRAEEVGSSGEKYTPLEKQVLQLQKDNAGTLLMVEVGYKYRFFGDDAKVAARELGIVCHPDRHFLTASIPTFRWDIHLKKLLSKGHRVGIVNQVETAALKKVSDNRNAPFDRQLVRLYTAATFVEDLSSVDDLEKYAPPPILCIVEDETRTGGKDGHVTIGLIAISPSTGDVVWDEFDDVLMRLDLETRIEHLRPTEILINRAGLTQATNKMLSHLTGNVRLENFDEKMLYTDAFDFVSEFYQSNPQGNGKLLATVSGFPRRVVVALAHIIKYLKNFDIADTLTEANYFERFTAQTRNMVLGANTLHNLEIFRNETDGTIQGSLLSVLDHTKTKFGARLLKRWVGQPLTNKTVLQERTDAVEEILASSSDSLLTVRQLLKTLPDLAKGLSRIHYGQCTPNELAVILPAFNKIATAFEPFSEPSDCGFTSSLLNEIIFSLPSLKEPIQKLLDAIDLKAASEGRKEDLWKDAGKYPNVEDCYDLLRVAEAELMDERKSLRKLLKLPAFDWTTVAGEEYLVEIKNTDKRPIPASWPLISKTKYNSRYRPPEVKEKMDARLRAQETLQAECNRAFRLFLSEIAEHYGVLRNAINKLATADCLFSLAQVALKPNYVRPSFSDTDELEIVDGRHPMVEVIRLDPFIPNTIRMGAGGNPRSKIITGPNMGGKSSLVRMVALIAIMAQIGSYVPATSARLSMVDAILTRMGAYDDLIRGRSTFMVEMSETSDILRTATSRSLVILDELGRGTSTFDGAIASATLQHLLQETRCKTLFITHYPMVAIDLSKKFPHLVENMHMGYKTEPKLDGSRNITFLYLLASGVATESFGIECGRLAKLPEEILQVASERAANLRTETEGRISVERMRSAVKRIRQCLQDKKAAKTQLHTLLDMMDS